MTIIEWFSLGAVVLIGLVAAALLYGNTRWNALTRQLNARLEAARSRSALRDGAPIIAAATVQHSGMFNLSDSGGEQWKPFTSTQRVVTRRRGFVWDGRVQMLPGLALHVHDAYVAGEGLLHPAIAGLFTLADLRDSGGDVARGELMRFFAEAAWYPTALLPSQGVRWEAVDDMSARATLTDGPITLTLAFRFATDTGLVESVRAESRGRTVQGRVIPTPWEGRWSNTAERDGMRVPLTGEVAWLTAEGRKPYWRGTITAVAYEFAPP